jgi:hypothetical protein
MPLLVTQRSPVARQSPQRAPLPDAVRVALEVISRFVDAGSDTSTTNLPKLFNGPGATILDPAFSLEALQALGRAPEPAVPTTRMDYASVLAMSPGIHPSVKSAFDAELENASTDVGLRSVDAIVEAVDEHYGTLGSWQSCPVPLGVVGIVAQALDTPSFLVMKRSHEVAVNPGVWTTTIDGGCFDHLDWPWENLKKESKSEAPWTEKWDWTYLGVSFPSNRRVGVARSGLNACFGVTVEDLGRFADPTTDEVSFESIERRIAAVDEILEGELRPCSDSLYALAEHFREQDHAMELSNPQGPHLMPKVQIRDRSKDGHGSSEAQRTMPAMQRNSLSGEGAFGSRFFAALIRRYPLLADIDNESLDIAGEIDLSATRDELAVVEETFPLIASFLTALEVLRVHRDETRLDLVDFARLYEGVVYRLSHNLFRGSATWPQRLAAAVRPSHYGEQSPYSEELTMAATAARERIVQYHAGKREIELPADVGYTVDLYLERPGDDTRLRLDFELLLYCTAIHALRQVKDPRVAQYAMAEDHRFSFTGNPIALFFKSVALIATPYTAVTPLRLGYEFCRGALTRYPGQAGIHHTAALYELKLSETGQSRQAVEDWLVRSLASVNKALTLDPEWPEFYATRARARRRRGDMDGATFDYQMALELVLRYPPEDREGLDAWTKEWTSALEDVAGDAALRNSG